MLRAFVSPSHKDWDLFLPVAEFAYNTARQESTQQAPFTLLYGKLPLHPLDAALPDLNKAPVPTASQVFAGIQEKLQNARNSIERAQLHQKKYADKKRREIEFEEGDQVLLSSINLPLRQGVAKFRTRWLGPFEIIKKLSPTAYRLQLPSEFKIHNVFHISLLKPFHGGPRWVKRNKYASQEHNTKRQ